MTKRTSLLHQHLEDIHWRVLDQYPQIVKKLIKRQSGVYALYNGRTLYYVGLASNLMRRLESHLKDRHRKSWDRFSVYLTQDHRHMKELESLILRIVRPRGNKVRGGFAGSVGQRKVLNRLMMEADADRRADILGGRMAEQHIRRKVSKAKRANALTGVSRKAIGLRGKGNHHSLHARLRPDGHILFKGRLYSSPSAAAVVALGRQENGWSFWQYRDTSGKWVPLKSLKPKT